MANYSIRGLVIHAATRQPLADLRVEAWDKDLLIDDLLGAAVTDDKGNFNIEFETRIYNAIIDRQPDVYFKVLRQHELLTDTRRRVVWNLREPGLRAIIAVPGVDGPGDPHQWPPREPVQVEGQVTTMTGVAVVDVRVEVRDVHLGGDRLLAIGVTDDKGRYSVRCDSTVLGEKARPDLLVRVLDPRQQNAEIARSAVIYEAEPHVVVNLSVTAADVKRPTEYERLVEAAQPVLGTTALRDLDARGVEYVANRIGWDARTVAMAAQAGKLSQTTKIPAAHYYALMRTGVPGELATLHRLPDASVERSLRLAQEGGVIPTAAPIDQTMRIHREQAAPALATYAPKTAVSSLGHMLALSLDQAQTQTFLDVYRATADRPDEMWSMLAQRGFDTATIARLQTDGKLGFLTRQNAPLIAKLRQTAQISTVEDLPRAGLYKAEAWKPLVDGHAPAGISADHYAAGLAAQVNLSFPTLVLSEMVRRRELPVDAHADGESRVAAFLREGHAKHTIGVDPVKKWDGYEELSERDRDSVRLVERLYQLTPSHESMVALHRTGLHSAMHITRQPAETFLLRHGDTFPSADEAKMVYQKAQEIHSNVLHLATTYLTYRGAPNVYALTGATTKLPATWESDVPGAPTLEELLKDLDYCACDHCKSVLGPAAYFVELLQFVDADPLLIPAGKKNPQTVLFERRPDLQDLLLSCENTNVALPYIDLVNEVLEHWVVNGSLAAFRGHNMREDSQTAELLADPEFVQDAAFVKTKDAVYPHALPFDMPLAALRLFMQGWDTTLPDALRLLGTPASARRETLRLNGPEYSMLTSVGFKALPEYFGEPAGATIDQLNAAISEGKTFCRRADVSYENLVAILRTRFINPGAPLAPLLHELHVSLATLQSWYTGAIDDNALKAQLPPGLDPAPYGNDVLQWLRDHRALIMGLITLTDVSAEASECSFATVELRYALPDPAANRLDALAYHKLHRFIRLWRKLGWSIELTDQVLTTFLGIAPEALTLGNLDATFTALLARLANFSTLLAKQSISKKKIADWLAIWDAAEPKPLRAEKLAHLLRIGTTDLEHFADISGIDPLAHDMANNSPSLLAFLDAWKALKAANLKVVDVDYLLRHRDDAGTLTPTPTALLRDLKALRDGLTAVAADVGAPLANADLAYARAKLALVYDGAVVDRFVELLSGSITYDATFNTVEESLPKNITEADARVGFDPFAKRLTYTGIPSAAAAAALSAAADTLVLADMDVITDPGDLATYIADFKAALPALVAAGQADLTALDAEYHELKLVYDAVAGIADPAALAMALIDQILPVLRRRLQTTSLRMTLAAQLKTDLALVDVLTSGPTVVRAVSDINAGVLTDFQRLDGAVALDADGGWELHLDPPTTDDYILYVGAPVGTSVKLEVGGATVIPATAVGASGEVQTAAELSLRAGALTPVVVTLATLPTGKVAELRWRTRGMAKSPVPAWRMYSDVRLADARASLLRLQKAALLLRAVPLTPRELSHLAAVNVDTVGILNGFDIDGTIAAPALHAQCARLGWLSWFAQLKADEPDEDTWVRLLEKPDQQTPAGKRVLAGVAGWSEQNLTDVLAHFGVALTDLSALHALQKVKVALDFISATNQPAFDFLAWVDDSPDAALIASIKQQLRDRQDTASWRATLQSVNDALRNQRRDALVAYILHHQAPSTAIDTADKLYEYFLIDVAMDACMMTSRIRLALSTVQLFITRCLMSLESDVSPSSLRADHWAWMKRYRVWEANRKIFLWPENWLEPELRDNKSPFFRELESELLKSDITDELAEDAYLSYLKKLDDVARLQIMGCYLEERTPGNPDDDVLHVFGRTNGNTHQYYYRRYEYGYWTPWEKMSLHIEGDHLFPVIWKKQLYVFWLTTVQKPQTGNRTESPSAMGSQEWGSRARLTMELTLAWGEYYKGKWTSPKSSEMKDPIRLTDLTVWEPEKVVLTGTTFRPSPDVSERLMIGVLYMGVPMHRATVTFTSKNAAPQIRSVHGLQALLNPDQLLNLDVFYYYLYWQIDPSSRLDANTLREPSKLFKVSIAQPQGAPKSTIVETVLTKTGAMLDGFRLRGVMHPVANQFEAPLFYDDERATFFVAPDERIEKVPHFKGFYVPEPPPTKIEIPPLYERPTLPDPMGPVINPLQPLINPRYANAIAGNDVFYYGGVPFDARGTVTAGKGAIR